MKCLLGTSIEKTTFSGKCSFYRSKHPSKLPDVSMIAPSLPEMESCLHIFPCRLKCTSHKYNQGVPASCLDLKMSWGYSYDMSPLIEIRASDQISWQQNPKRKHTKSYKTVKLQDQKKNKQDLVSLPTKGKRRNHSPLAKQRHLPSTHPTPCTSLYFRTSAQELWG